MQWVLSNPKTNRVGHAQEQSIIKWKWYISERAKAGEGGTASLHEKIAEITEEDNPPITAQVMEESPVKWGKSYEDLTEEQQQHTWFTDGSARYVSGKRKWKSVAYNPKLGKHLTMEGDGKSSQYAELYAVFLALAFEKGGMCHLYTDSWSVANGLATWMMGWKKYNWLIHGKEIKQQQSERPSPLVETTQVPVRFRRDSGMASGYSRLGTQQIRTFGRESHLQVLCVLIFGILGGGYLGVDGWTPGRHLITEQVWPHRRPGDWNVYNLTDEGPSWNQILFSVNLSLTDERIWYYGPPNEDLWNYPGRYKWPYMVFTNGSGTVTIQAEDAIYCWTEGLDKATGLGRVNNSIWNNYMSKAHNTTEHTFNLTGSMIIACANATNRQVNFPPKQRYPPCDNSTGAYNGTGPCSGKWGGIPGWRDWMLVYLNQAYKTDPGHMKRIPSSCVKTGTQSRKTVVSVIVTFPSDAICPVRRRRAWYDTILGGVGAVTGTLNSFDIETLANRMSNAGKGIQDVLTLQGQWMPTIWRPWNQALGIDAFLLQMKTASDSFMFEVDSNVSKVFNWTVCTLQTMYQMQQKTTMQTQLMTGNEQVWRTVFNNTIPNTSWLKIETSKMICNDTACQGIINIYNVTNQQIMCRYVVLPFILGAPGHQWFWMPKMNGLYLDDNNKTYDLSLCDDTLEGKICRLHSTVYEPCLLQSTVNVCEFTILPTTFKMLVEIGSQEICVITDTPVIAGMQVPFAGCLQNVSTLQWENQTFLLTHDLDIQKTVYWKPNILTTNNWDLNLTRLQNIITNSEEGQKMIKSLNKTIQQHAITIVAGKIVKMGSSIQEATSHHWWDIFMGYSPSAERMLNWLIHPVLFYILCTLPIGTVNALAALFHLAYVDPATNNGKQPFICGLHAHVVWSQSKKQNETLINRNLLDMKCVSHSDFLRDTFLPLRSLDVHCGCHLPISHKNMAYAGPTSVTCTYRGNRGLLIVFPQLTRVMSLQGPMGVC
ncbi:uncharacterized protein [Engystomops pustulosus]|uniref:uncharacterized protein n=1 Tax=Engystomops pustulosus TaxID=76066 RepID=UPI003AFB81B6